MAIALVCLALTAAAAVVVWAIHAALHTRARGRIARREVLADYLTCLATTTDDRAAAAVLHELDDLAQRDPALRQAAVDGFCAYLRRPAPPGPCSRMRPAPGPPRRPAPPRCSCCRPTCAAARRAGTGRHVRQPRPRQRRRPRPEQHRPALGQLRRHPVQRNHPLHRGPLQWAPRVHRRHLHRTVLLTTSTCTARSGSTAPASPARRRSPRPPSTAASTSPQRCSPLRPTSPLRGSSATPPSTTRAAGRHSSPTASSSIEQASPRSASEQSPSRAEPTSATAIRDAPACRGPRLHP